jgi:hypothetical protein
VSEDEVFVAGAFYTDIECIEDGSTAHVCLGQLVNKAWCGSGLKR